MNISPKAAIAFIVGLVLLAYGAYRGISSHLQQTAQSFVADSVPAIVNSVSTDELLKRMSPRARQQHNEQLAGRLHEQLENLAVLGKLKQYHAPAVDVAINYQFPSEVTITGNYTELVDFEGGQVSIQGLLENTSGNWGLASFAAEPLGDAFKKIYDWEMKKTFNASFVDPGTQRDGPKAFYAIEFDFASLLSSHAAAAMLDGMFAHAFSPDDRVADGRTTLSLLGESVDQMVADRAWDRHLADIKAWETQSPQSASAPVIEAQYWISYAWDARGNGYADSITTEGSQLFHERVVKAQQVLIDAKPNADSNPLWYSTMVQVAMGLGDMNLLRSTFDEGQQKFPEFDGLYFDTARALLPKWYGNVEMEDQLVRSAVKATSAKEGESMYARIYWHISAMNDGSFDLFRDSRAQWPEMKLGFNDLMQRYPGSNWLTNNYAAFACMAGDKNTFQAMRSQLGSKVDPEAWPSNHSFDLCNHLLGGP